jgi:hypothetical protein
MKMQTFMNLAASVILGSLRPFAAKRMKVYNGPLSDTIKGQFAGLCFSIYELTP